MKRKRSSSTGAPKLPRGIHIGADYGTTFSGAAWANTTRPELQTAIVEWPDVNGSLEGQTSDKVPTQLLYKDNDSLWGFAIPDDEPRYQWFKLGLDPDQLDQEISLLAIDYPDPKALPSSYDANVTAMKLTTDYLTQLQQHIIKILRLKLGDSVVDTTPIRYTLTLPAIWSDAAKVKTQKCAEAAGMGSVIQIVTEPEAAVIYALDVMDPHNLKTNDRFVLCDAGGGIVDLISYTIVARNPIVKVREAVPGSGGACGSTFLNRIFQKYLEDTLGELDGYGRDTLEEAMSEFEKTTKRKFTGNEQNVMVRVPGMADNVEKRIKRQKLAIPATVLKDLFKPVMSAITSLVKVEKGEAVILVGGFGQSPYLRNCIRQVIGEGIEILQPPNGWSAIARGALLKALHDTAPELSRVDIASRQARRAYGIRSRKRWDRTEHQGQLKTWNFFSGNYTVDEMKWFVSKGDDLDQKSPVVTSWTNQHEVSEGRFLSHSVDIYVFEPKADETSPRFPCQEAKKLIALKADLSSIAERDIPVKIGADGTEYYSLSYEIRVGFFSAHIEFSLWYKGKQYGKVDMSFT